MGVDAKFWELTLWELMPSSGSWRSETIHARLTQWESGAKPVLVAPGLLCFFLCVCFLLKVAQQKSKVNVTLLLAPYTPDKKAKTPETKWKQMKEMH